MNVAGGSGRGLRPRDGGPREHGDAGPDLLGRQPRVVQEQLLVARRMVADNPMPPALERLVLACLEKRPEARPQTAGALMAALDRLALAVD